MYNLCIYNLDLDFESKWNKNLNNFKNFLLIKRCRKLLRQILIDDRYFFRTYITVNSFKTSQIKQEKSLLSQTIMSCLINIIGFISKPLHNF